MKRFLSLLIAVVMVLSMVPVISFAEDEVIIYIDPKNGSNETGDGTEEAPVQNFTTAYSLLQETGGTIVMLSTVYYASTYTFPACDHPVTITGKTGAEGIRIGSNIIVSGETTFENMTFTLLKASTATMICGNGHKLTMGKNLTIVPYVNDTDSYYFCLQGGHPSNAVENTDLTVQSGQYRNIYAGSYTKTVTGNAKLTMTGGTAATVTPGYSGSVNGNVEISLSGSAEVTGNLYSGSWTTGNIGGNSTVTLGQGAKGKNLFAAGNGTGSVTGTTTMIFDGYAESLGILKGTGNNSHTGTLGGSQLVLKSGKLTKSPVGFGCVDIDIPQGKTLTLAATVTADTLTAAGTLNFSGAAALTAKAVTGSVACTIEGTVLKNQVYVTAPAGSAITFPEDSGITEHNGTWVCQDLENFSGLVLKHDAAAKCTLYGEIWAQSTGTTYTAITPFTTETVDGYTYKYYPNATGNFHVRASRSGYITLYKNIHQTSEEAAVKTVEEITLQKKGTNGYVPQTIYSHTTETLNSVWKSEASMFPKYENALVNPVFQEGRDPHQMTTNAEMEQSIASADKADDDMYVFSLGKTGEYGYNIPAVIFTKSDLSAATTLEEAAALMDDSRLTVYYRAQMHGNEPGGTEGALAMIHYLQQGYADEILDKLNVIIVPRLSPDGSQLYQRLLPSGINPNRDQLRLESAEMQAFQKGYLLFDPEIVLDGHERVWNNQYGDIQVSASFTPMNSDAWRTTALEMDKAAFRELEANGLNGYYYATAVNEKDPNMGGGYYAAAGSIYVLLETRGIYGGNEAMERRAVAHMAAVTGMLDYLYDNDTAVKSMIAAERAAIAENGATCEEEDLFVLQTDSRITTAADVESWGALVDKGLYINWATGGSSIITKYAKAYDVVAKTRVAPTAYVIPADIHGIAQILALMDRHGIAYTYLPEGATLNLQRYSGDTAAATLSAETLTRFANGCYVFTMNQEKGLLLATLIEPDNTNAAEFYGSIAQMGLVAVSDTYRYIRDLNAQGTVDYTVTEAELTTITVYLDGTNGDDTADGLTEATAVKTLEQAYVLMNAALSSAEEGSCGNLIIIGMYDLGAKQYKLPAASYPVNITGKTAADGILYTGGSSQAARTFELQGPTSFRNMTIHINNTESFNFFLANGHKLTIGEGVNCTTNKANCYFTLAGGDYDYTDTTASADITVRSGKWRTIYAGGYRASVTGQAKADISGCWIYQNIAATYCGTIGSVDIKISDTTVSTNVASSAIYMGPVTSNAKYQVGAVLGDSTLTLGENVSAQAVYCSSRDNGNIYGTATVIADGADLSALPVYATYSATTGTTNAALLKLGANVTQDVTLDENLPLDLNGFDITGSLTVDGTLTVYDSATDDYDVSDGKYGEITGSVTGTLIAADGYIAAADGFHKFDQYISGVALRPANAGIYYTATFLCDQVLAAEIETGVAVSLADLPGADFETDEDTLYTKGTTGVMIDNILKGDIEDADRAIIDIYAISYVKLKDGTVLVSENQVAYSLYDVLLILKEQNPEAFNSFCTTHNITSWF